MIITTSLVFSLYAVFIVVAFMFSLTPAICSSTKLDFVCFLFLFFPVKFFLTRMISADILSAYKPNCGAFEGTIIYMLPSGSHKTLKISEYLQFKVFRDNNLFSLDNCF